MNHEMKTVVSKEDVFNKLEIRVGRVIDVELEPSAPKPSYRMVIDFGKLGKRISGGRFTQHPIEDVRGRLVLGVLNFEARMIGNVLSEALVLGVQCPKAESGEATFVPPATNAKIGSKLF